MCEIYYYDCGIAYRAMYTTTSGMLGFVVVITAAAAVQCQVSQQFHRYSC